MAKKLRVALATALLMLTGCTPATNVVNTPVTTDILQSPDLTAEPVELIAFDEPSAVEVVEVEPIEIVEFRVTAYCACAKCCGNWANSRPQDEFGNPIVKGAAGTVLETGVSVASPYPFGTEIELLDYGVVIVEDRTASWVVDKYGENIVDIYFADHNSALEFGVHTWQGVIL